MRARSNSGNVSDRLRALRARSLRDGARSFELIFVGGVRVARPRSLGSFSSVAEALQAARRFGVSSAVVRTWAELPEGVRVHLDSVEWLLSWQRVAGPLAGTPGAHSRAAASMFGAPNMETGRAGASGAPRVPTSNLSGLFV